MRDSRNRWLNYLRAKVFAVACVAVLFGATVFQGMSFCLCQPVAANHSRAEDTCPCHAHQHKEGGGQSEGVALTPPPHVCNHLAFDVLLSVKQDAKTDGGAVGHIPLNTFFISAQSARPADVSQRVAMTRDRHKPPLGVTLRRQLC